MAIQQKLQTKLAQKLILTPSLQQAIKLLPMSTLELADLLNQEVVENPLLEEVPTEELAAVDGVGEVIARAARSSRPLRRRKAAKTRPRTRAIRGTTPTMNIFSASTSRTATVRAHLKRSRNYRR